MNIEIKINVVDPESTDAFHTPYIGWAPSPLMIRDTSGSGGVVTLTNVPEPNGGELVFIDAVYNLIADPLQLVLPPNGAWSKLFIAGKYLRGDTPDMDQAYASERDKDTAIVVCQGDCNSANEIHRERLMVRVRKDVNKMSDGERERFRDALAVLNAGVPDGFGGSRKPYEDFQRMHGESSGWEIHFRNAFLPWHRFYILNLERELQLIDPSVALPFWNWDNPAPHVFTLDFWGVSKVNNLPGDLDGKVEFSDTNPLKNWQTLFGPLNRSYYNADPAENRGGAIEDSNLEEKVLSGEVPYGQVLETFRGGTPGVGGGMESRPHGSGHNSFRGYVSNLFRAPSDPIFFLIHCNVDRLWAKWQNKFNRFEIDQSASYVPQGSAPVPMPPYAAQTARPNDIGNFINDSLWPWDGDTNKPRPNTAPVGAFPSNPKFDTDTGEIGAFIPEPGPFPTIKDSIDYQGRFDGNKRLGFDYIDVSFSLIPNEISPILVRSMDVDPLQNIQLAFDGSEEVAKRLNAIESISLAMSGEDRASLLSLVRNPDENPEIRTAALKIYFRINEDEAAYDVALSLIRDKTEPNLIRLACISLIQESSFGSETFIRKRGEYYAALRGILKEKELKELMLEALGLLAHANDEYTQRLLIKGLKTPAKSLVPASTAIRLLSADSHADDLDLIKKLATSAPDIKTRVEAIRYLAVNPQSADLLTSILGNPEEPTAVREAAVTSLHLIDMESLHEDFKHMIVDEGTDRKIRTALMNSLVHFGNMEELREDSDFLDQLEAVERSAAAEFSADATAMHADQKDSLGSLVSKLKSKLND